MIVDNKYKVEWEHLRDSTIEIRATKCKITEIETNLIAQGFAFCSNKDQFNKDIGRKISMKNALMSGFTTDLEVLNINKEKRTIFWKTYFNRNDKSRI
jgi:hypothetical protein